MKNFKTKIVPLVLAAILISATTSVYAKESLAGSQADITFTKDLSDAGELKFTTVSYLEFGSHVITKATTEFLPADDLIVKIEDTRRDETGWQLSSAMGEFTDNAFPSATLTIAGGASTNTALIPDSITLTPNNVAVAITETFSGEIGTADLTWKKDNIKLKIQGNEMREGRHVSNILWTLSDTP